MYLSDVVEKNVKDVLETEEDELFRAIFELDSKDLGALLDAGLLNEQAMRIAIHQFRRADEASFTYTGSIPAPEAMTKRKPMPKPVEEILVPRPEMRLRIYAWTPNDPPAEYVGLVKVGHTAQADVNARIRQSQGQMQQAYTLHVDVLAERDDGTIFSDGDVRRRLIDKGFENIIIGSSARVDALLGRRREDRAHRTAHRASGSPARITRPSRCAASRPRP